MNFPATRTFVQEIMLIENQNTIIYLMFLSGILFLGLNFIAYSIIFSGPPGSKRNGYTLIIAAISAFLLQQESQALISLEFSPEKASKILLAGFAAPVFLVSLVYYRIKRNRKENKTRTEAKTTGDSHKTD